MSEPEIQRKAVAYITRQRANGEPELLVFLHVQAPELGLEVPAGSMEADEEPEVAVLREAFEESNLAPLEIVSFLGRAERDLSHYFGRPVVADRWFYHLAAPGETPDRWKHAELSPSDGTPGPIPFELFWVPLDSVPELRADLGKLLPILRNRLGVSEHD